MNRQIRTLGVGLMVAVRRPVHPAQRGAGRAGRPLRRRPRQQPRPSCATSPDPAAPSSRPTARSWPRASRRATGTATSARYPTGELFANVSGYFSFTLGSTQLERTQNDTLSGQHRAARAAGAAGTCSTTRSTPATSSRRCEPTSSRWPRTPSATATAASSCSTPAPVPSRRCGATRATTPTSSPSHDFDAAKAAKTFYDAVPGQAAAGQQLPGALPAGLDLQGHHRDRGAGERQVHARLRTSRRSSPTSRPRRPTPSRTTAARRAAAPSSRCSGAAATPRSPRWRVDRGRAGHGRHGRALRLQPRAARSTCPGRPKSVFGTGRGLREQHPAARHRRLRTGQHAGHPAGDGPRGLGASPTAARS